MSVGGWGWGRGTGMVCQSGGEDDQGEDEQGEQSAQAVERISIIDRIRNKLTAIFRKDK